MVGVGDEKRDVDTKGKPSLGFSLPFADYAPSNPFDVMTAAAVAGIALSNQFAGAFFGMMQGALSAGVAAEAKGSTISENTEAATVPTKVDAVIVSVNEAAAGVIQISSGLVGDDVKKVEKASGRSALKRKADNAKQTATLSVSLDATPDLKPAKVAKTIAQGSMSKRKRRSEDLKKISGIGPKLEMLLNGMGVLDYRTIAGWTDKEVEHFDRELELDGRIAKDDWIAQAKALLR